MDAALLTAALLLVLAPGRSHAESKAEFPADASQAKAVQYAALDHRRCIEALEQRKINFSIEKEAPGVLIPVRLLGPLHGVTWRTDFSAEQRRTTPYEVLDCRLLLALDDFSRILEKHDVEEVRVFSFWRPPAKDWPKDKIAKRHPGGLAADVRLFKKRPKPAEEAPKQDGETKEQAKRSSPKKKSPRKSKKQKKKGSAENELSVLDDFGGKIGGKACGKGATPPKPDSAKARELREIYCEAAGGRLFNVMLSPHFDKHHFNHFHLEVAAGVKWFIVD
ncbi:MAG: hypothetical protein H6718_34820 [Polyangiaceae bacterium]|nr:hypothetical protein [Myxococcales bacterium]MCB9590633.1 hypothetical protein [Polyangiaceae bacterium]MCB9608101.1 hypothetical protein [Polyangiaceae bacterium]